MFRQLSHRTGVAYALNSLGFSNRWSERWSDAEPFFRAALTVALEAGDLEAESGSRRGLADVCSGTGRLEEAGRWYASRLQ